LGSNRSLYAIKNFQKATFLNSTDNSGGRQKKEFNNKIQPWLNSIDFIKFSNNDKLYGRIFYFNHDTAGIRDIHNILKPIFDRVVKR